jgi:signal transduction histidine kinase
VCPKQLSRRELEAGSLPVLRYALGRAAHDLNNYLSGLLGYFSLIKDRLGGDPNCARFFGFMEHSGADMAALLKAIADFGEQSSPDAKPVDANAAVRTAVSQLAASGQNELAPTLDLDEALPCVRAQAETLRDAVGCLLRNAFEASAARPAPVTVRTALAAMPADALVPPGQGAEAWVRIEVEDSGAGMDEEAVRRCVVPFYTTKRATRQHGLGLSLACSHVCAWGGGLDVRSAPGAGARVSLYLHASQDK